MSEPFPASEVTSPVSSVRSSGAHNDSNHVSSTASPPESKAITPTTPPYYHGTESHSPDLRDEDGDVRDSSYRLGSHNGFHDNDSSDPNTPRLPPTTIGNDDLEKMPKEEAIHLDHPDKAPSNSAAQYSIHHLSPPQSSSSTISSSVSEPTSRIAPQRYTQEIAPPERVNGVSSVSSWLEKAQKHIGPSIESAALSHSPRTNPYNPHHHSRMSGTWDEEQGYTIGGMERSAREEAFSEKRNRSSSRSSQSRVEKRIEATLADAEPSSHASSRKSSHTLGLFKETTATQGNRSSQERSRTASDNAIDASTLKDHGVIKQRPHARSVFESPERDDGAGIIRSSERPSPIPGKQGIDVADGRTPFQDSKQSSRPTSRSSTEAASRSRNVDDVLGTDPKDQAATRSSKESDASKHNVPARLLEEIRNYHNLTAPFHDKFRALQPKSSGPTQDKADDQRLSQPQKDVSRDHDGGVPGSEATITVEPETEEDDAEHISSALYYPHQAPSPDALEDVSIDDARKIKEASIDLETQLPEPALSPVDQEGNERSEDVDIALQVHNKNRYFHGDLSKAQPLSTDFGDNRQASESDASSASESDYESQDENKPHGMRDDSLSTDDGETTPRASPSTRKSYLLSRTRKTHRGPAAPLGAVELKPYNHQVGGHTNLFRFSKRAVCKQLSNRENEFYEVVERQHPELLKFLPKYEPQ